MWVSMLTIYTSWKMFIKSLRADSAAPDQSTIHYISIGDVMTASRLLESYHTMEILIDLPTVAIWGGTLKAHNRTSELWISQPPRWLTAKEKGREHEREREEGGKKRGKGLALSPPCLSTSWGMSLEWIEVPGFDCGCCVTVFPMAKLRERECVLTSMYRRLKGFFKVKPLKDTMMSYRQKYKSAKQVLTEITWSLSEEKKEPR